MKTFNQFIQEKKAEKQEYVYLPFRSEVPTGKGHAAVGATWLGPDKNIKGANIMRHKDGDKYFASGGSSNAITANTKFFKTPEEAATEYHKNRTIKFHV